MAIHNTPSSMLKESLDELLEAVRYCADYRKNDEKWGEFKTGGCLGYPSAILLFSIIDSIGSYFRSNINFIINIDDKKESIDSDGWQHFKILNSKYFKQHLSKIQIQTIYKKFRSLLTHNSILGKNSIMIMENENLNNGIKDQAFILGKNDKGEPVYLISIKELWNLCKIAIEEFKKDIDMIVPNSKQGKKFI